MRTTAPRAVAVRLLLAASVLLTALLGVLGSATPAVAHASLTGSDPAQGAVVATAPDSVMLTFSEQVALSEDSIKVLDPTGERVDTGELQDLCTTSVVRYGTPLRADVPEGTYTVAWQAVSADSHPVSGAFTFSVGAPSETSVSLPEEELGGGLVGALYDTARYFAYGGFVLLVGGAVFVLGVWREGASVNPTRRVVIIGWLTITVATVVTLLLRHPYVTGGSLGDSLDLGGLRAVIETKTGTALVSRLLLLGMATLFVAALFKALPQRREERERRVLCVGLALGGTPVAVGIAATWALAEHASTGMQTRVAMPVALVHLLAVALWLGGLVTLWVALRAGVRVPRAAVRRFSQLAFASVLVLAGTGVYQSWRQVGSWSALTGTEYGRLLLGKLALLALLLAAAWYSRRWAGQLTDSVSAPGAGGEGSRSGQEHQEHEEHQGSEGRQERQEHQERGERQGATDGEDAAAPTRATDPVRRAQLERQAAARASARRQRQRDADAERAGLRRTVLTEATIAVVLLAVTTMLTGTEPARTASAATEAPATAVPDRPLEVSLPFDTGGPEGAGTAQVDLDPGRSGSNTLRVRTDVDAEEVRVAFTLPDKDIGPLSVAPERGGTRTVRERRLWSAENVQLPMPGSWQLSVTVRTSEIDQVTETKNVKIG